MTNRQKIKLLLADVHKYRVQKIKSCEECKYIRPYNNTCIKHSIRVNKTFGICNDYTGEDNG